RLHLPRLLSRIESQRLDEVEAEVVIVDSGSTDDTLEIAKRCPLVRITHIRKEDFSFGRSLNVGCEFARGDFLVFVSGHCIPASDRWLHELVEPLRAGAVQYSYGRQIGAETTKFSEKQLFAKYFPDHSLIPQDGFFCNNANAAIPKEVWDRYRFDESRTGLEDLELARRIVDDGGAVGYVAEAPVHHIHDESWGQVRHRYEREAIAMQRIAPNLHVTLLDSGRFLASAVLHDASRAIEEKTLLRNLPGIVAFRAMQYFGTYKGNRDHRKLSHDMKLRYYYPTSQHHPEHPHDDEVPGARRRSSAL
ncbi:MAG: glycosyltransferase family 2 protein, partial [Gemmatimonadota bacterium]|nr:glycosyltransferase family 2 protein [Gemmatimonadota bacterium]